MEKCQSEVRLETPHVKNVHSEALLLLKYLFQCTILFPSLSQFKSLLPVVQNPSD